MVGSPNDKVYFEGNTSSTSGVASRGYNKFDKDNDVLQLALRQYK
jgi:hypothetical protein